jgi:F0F1-type ATP synthase epsilon subunit
MTDLEIAETEKKIAKMQEKVNAAKAEKQRKADRALAKAFEKLIGAKNVTTVEELSAVLDDYFCKKNGY